MEAGQRREKRGAPVAQTFPALRNLGGGGLSVAPRDFRVPCLGSPPAASLSRRIPPWRQETDTGPCTVISTISMFSIILIFATDRLYAKCYRSVDRLPADMRKPLILIAIPKTPMISTISSHSPHATRLAIRPGAWNLILLWTPEPAKSRCIGLGTWTLGASFPVRRSSRKLCDGDFTLNSQLNDPQLARGINSTKVREISMTFDRGDRIGDHDIL